MIAPVPKARLLAPLALLAAALLCQGCAGEGLTVLAGGCWGQSSGDCRANQNPVLRALGYEGAELVALSAGLNCGSSIDCSVVAVRRTPAPRARPAAASASASAAAAAPDQAAAMPADGPPAADAGQAAAAGEAAVAVVVTRSDTPDTGDTPDSSDTPPPAEADPVAPPPVEPVQEEVAAVSVNSGSCKGIDIPSLEQRSALSGAQKTCLMDAAMGKASASDPHIQVAVIALYNTRSAGWKKAVEAALSRKNLRNAPNLNFAGIKPAYDSNRYGTVIARGNIVWRNLKKGYALTAEHLTFVTEYSCRSGLQLHLMQKPSDNAFEWCERWRSRLSKAGGSTAEADDILDQLED